jgi:hypothetical protein
MAGNLGRFADNQTSIGSPKVVLLTELLLLRNPQRWAYGHCVTATRRARKPATNATPSVRVRLKFDLIDSWAIGQGRETSDTDLADLLGIDRSTVYRWRKALLTPSLETTLGLARRIGCQVENLIEATERTAA